MHTLALSRKGQTEQVFDVLDSAIAEATHEHQGEGALVLLTHAAALAMAKGKRDREILYTERALPYAKDYRFAAYNFARLLLKDGQVDLAEHYAREAYKLSTAADTDADRDLTAAILKQWPP